MPKKFTNNRASVANGSNLVLCDTDFKPHYVKPGSIFKFNADPENYEISKVEDIYFVLDFNAISLDKLIVSDKEAKNFVLGDSVDLSYKEYNLNNNFEIISAGQGYEVGDAFNVSEGESQVDLSINKNLWAELEVSSVGENGAVTSLSLKTPGKYLSVPEGEILLAWSPDSDSGSGLEINLSFSSSPKRSAFTQKLIDIKEMDNGDFYLLLDSSLPSGVKFGKISAKKKALHLSTPYLSDSKESALFNTAQDFSQNLGLPYLLENSMSASTVFNKAMTIVDSRIKNLEDKISSLEEELRKKGN